AWGTHTDKIDGGKSFNIPASAVSDDGGLTWRETTSNDVVSHRSRSLMSNGKYFAGFVGKNGYVIEGLDEKYTPVLGPTYENKKLFRPEDLVAGGDLDLTYYASEFDPETGKTEKFECKVTWPNQLISAYYGKGYTDNTIHPPQREFSLGSGLADFALGDKLYYCVYARGFDPATGEIGKYSQYFSTFVFCSEDNARTWNVVSQINVNDEIIEESKNHKGHFEGFGEVKPSVMPDGSVALLVRTGSNQPCYIMRSTDECKTWSKPVKFDEVGVRPFIMALDCGVSLASYGRDGLFVRATADPSGSEWQEHIEIPFGEFGRVKSCYYTYMLPLDETSALLVYSDFYFTPTGKEADLGKSMIGRIITVEKK
ncbi:MAG: exo-alpha-sialidase, partial [Clostridia bacterium]|nr:exo-alpha-sialidase [Clostridia bacterium]